MIVRTLICTRATLIWILIIGKLLVVSICKIINIWFFQIRFSIGQLPQWAKKQLTEESSQPPILNKGVAPPKGRWAQRAETTMGGVQSFYSSQPLPFPMGNIKLHFFLLWLSCGFCLDKRFDSDGSKDSSLDSGTEVKLYQETKKETMTITTKVRLKCIYHTKFWVLYLFVVLLKSVLKNYIFYLAVCINKWKTLFPIVFKPKLHEFNDVDDV